MQTHDFGAIGDCIYPCRCPASIKGSKSPGEIVFAHISLHQEETPFRDCDVNRGKYDECQDDTEQEGNNRTTDQSQHCYIPFYRDYSKQAWRRIDG